MKNTLIASALALLLPLEASAALAMTDNTESIEEPTLVAQMFGYPNNGGVQYQPPSFFQGSTGAPIVVPPTVINTGAAARPPCRRSRISFAIFFEVDRAEC